MQPTINSRFKNCIPRRDILPRHHFDGISARLKHAKGNGADEQRHFDGGRMPGRRRASLIELDTHPENIIPGSRAIQE
jgi:hypothetical protein